MFYSFICLLVLLCCNCICSTIVKRLFCLINVLGYLMFRQEFQHSINIRDFLIPHHCSRSLKRSMNVEEALTLHKKHCWLQSISIFAYVNVKDLDSQLLVSLTHDQRVNTMALRATALGSTPLLGTPISLCLETYIKKDFFETNRRK